MRNNPKLIFHANKIRPWSWGTYFKLNVRKKIVISITCDYLMVMEIEKCIGNAKVAIVGILLIK